MIKSKNSFITPLIIVFDILVILGVIFLEDIAKFMIDYFPECFYYSKFGIECPTCGATRCVFNFFGLRFIEAFKLNPFIFLVIIYIFVLAIFLNLSLFKLKFAKTTVKAITGWKAWVVFATCFFGFAILRLLKVC